MHPTVESAPQVLLATDFSPASEAAAHAALEHARRLGARLHVLHVASRGATGENVGALRKVAGRLEDVPVVMAVDRGAPAPHILAYAAHYGVDLIVLGAHERRSAPGPLGSVAEAVTRAARCPVLAVPPEQAARVEGEAIEHNLAAQRGGR